MKSLPDGEDRASRARQFWTLGVTAAMVGSAAAGLVPTFIAVAAASLALTVTRTVTLDQVRSAVDVDILLMVSCAAGLGAAIQASGMADWAGDLVAEIALAAGPLTALAALAVGALLLTEVITNVAAAAMLIPVAVTVAERIGYQPVGLAVTVAVACSASFLTPIGYQTNTIVHGLGGYRFSDYWRLGLPLNLVFLAVTLTVVPAVWG